MSLKSGENPNGVKHQMNIPEKRGKEQKKPIAYWYTFKNLAPPKYSSC